ncbi:MAG: multidrug ABC transporter ATP-binding protein [Actinobacteria bacterium BACL4 MAG-120820-bin23]|jgi:ABC-2 type transport system ATP-binding protein|uniref:ABC transporter ATP-binding protein n=1 Tax=Candidatus Nanopelagicus sp. TaxID=2518620 RepID=UPI0007145A01|nr:MAG: multidrug ABC transporter ATP-binding protein [Actinobacteria bacterium BACL4 MAG-120820-bin23]
MSSPLALDVADLSKKYGDRMALSHANFEVPMGSICGFVGPNGSGKTTTIRMLLGLITPSTGSGHVLGESITQPEKYLPKVGAMIEGPAFYPALTGKQNLAVLAKLGGFSTDQIQKLLELVDLGDRGDSKFKTYSLGMKQRLGIAAALLPNPKLLVLDEPTNGLDPAGIHEVRTLLRKLADNGTTVFVSSHLLSEIEMISDYLVMLRQGKVIFSGKTSDLLAAQKPLILAKPENQNDLVKLNQIAQGLGLDSKIKEDLVEASADANFAAKLNKAAFDAGITLTSLTSIRPTLEETFFEMTVN